MYHSAFTVLRSGVGVFFAQKTHLIHWVLGGFTNIAIKSHNAFIVHLISK